MLWVQGPDFIVVIHFQILQFPKYIKMDGNFDTNARFKPIYEYLCQFTINFDVFQELYDQKNGLLL